MPKPGTRSRGSRPEKGKGKDVPDVWPVALTVGDLHLSEKPPIARSAEPDWLETQAGYLRQVEKLRTGLGGADGKLDVFCTGDVFDRWNASPAVINLALRHVRYWHCIAGNHDLPNHDPNGMDRSAYECLVRAGRLTDISSFETRQGQVIWYGPGYARSCLIAGHGWGVKPTEAKGPDDLKVALVHRYVWCHGHSHPGAKEEDHADQVAAQFPGFQVLIFGDNHKPFSYRNPKTKQVIYNGGGFMCRTTDERDHKPSVGIIMSDGNVVRHYLDVSNDKWVDKDVRQEEADTVDARAFLAELAKLGDAAIDFAAAAQRAASKCTPGVQKIVNEILEGK